MIFLKSQSNKKRLTKLLVIGFLVLAGLGFGGDAGAKTNAETLRADIVEIQKAIDLINLVERAYNSNIDAISKSTLFGDIKGGLTALQTSREALTGDIETINRFITEQKFDDVATEYTQQARSRSTNSYSQANTLNATIGTATGRSSEEIAEEVEKNNKALNTAPASTPPGSGSGVLNGLQNAVGSMISWVLYYIAVGLDRLLMLIINVMFSVVLFNNFVHQPIVTQGWAMIRDLCNGFFIILMMIMAAGITVKFPGYQWRSMLPKILLYAILVNFSLTITGLLIDFSQVVMLAFAAPLATTMGKGLILQAIGLPGKYEFSNLLVQRGEKNSDMSIGWTDIITALLFAVVASIIAIVVVGAITLTLIWRIILLVFLCVLSPLPYIARSTDKIKQIGMLSSEWNSRFTNMLVVGPAMMFFLYLSFNAMQLSVNNGGDALLQDENVTAAITQRESDPRYGDATPLDQTEEYTDYNAITNAFSLQGLFKFLLVVGFLWLSLEMGKKFGDAASSIAGKAQGKVLSGLKSYSGFNLGMKGVKAVANKASALPGTAVKMAGAKLGTGTLGLTSVAVGGLGSITGSTGLQKLGEVGKQWRQDVLGGRRKNRQAKLSKFMGKIGAGSDAMKEKWGEFTDTDFAKRAKTVGLGVTSAVTGAGAALGLTALTVGTGGAILPALAAGYLGGGGRLVEMFLGQKANERSKNKEAKKKKVDEAKATTSKIITDSETARDVNIENDLRTYFSNPQHRQAKNAYDAAQKRIADIENAKLTNTNRRNGRGLDNAILTELNVLGWQNGQEITEDMLNQAKNAAKSRNQGDWQNLQQTVSSFQTTHQPIIDNINNYRENEHRQNVIDQLDRRISSATTPEDRNLAEIERRRFETEYDANVTLNLNTTRIKEQLDLALEAINSDPNTSEFDKIVARRLAQEEHDKEISRVNKYHSDAIAPVQHQEPQPNILSRMYDGFLEGYKPYAHENWVSQGVAAEAKKMKESIKNLIEAIENGGADVLDSFEQISKGNFYSQSGQTEVQFKTIKALTDSTTGITNLINSLSKMPKDLSGAQAQLVKELKQGIAAYKKGGGDVSKLTAVITLLDQKKGFNKEGKVIDDKTVSEYETNIKPKK